ncbi:MAG: hypothetical protein IKU42_00430 [Oscillospiraceae bacterium]|nr:hypothetical protein [Oscillospiraceae bacterium]
MEEELSALDEDELPESKFLDSEDELLEAELSDLEEELLETEISDSEEAELLLSEEDDCVDETVELSDWIFS